mgnify:CR=1 FL=1
MRTITRLLLIPLLLSAQLTAMASSPANWVDAISFTLGEDANSNETDVYRVGLQNKWERSWFEGGAWYVSGYWDAELAYLESGIGQDDGKLHVSTRLQQGRFELRRIVARTTGDNTAGKKM